MCSNWTFSQVDKDTSQVKKKDTVYVNESGFDELGKYSSADSIYADLRAEKIYLYRDAHVEYGDIIMDAGFIVIDLRKNELTATYLVDSLGEKIGQPTFTDGQQNVKATSIRYNLDTKKGYIKDLQTQQDEINLYMWTAKVQPNEEVHFVNGRFTTCDLEEPHFHFQLSRAVMVPKKRIVSEPMNLYVKGVPTPLGLPFIFLPQSSGDQAKGFMFPQIVPSSPYGFGFHGHSDILFLSTTIYRQLYMVQYIPGVLLD